MRFFRWTALLFGLLFVFLIPPFQAPDEYNHFYRAYQISEGGWLGQRTADQRLGGELPRSLSTVTRPFLPLLFDYDRKTQADTIAAALRVPLDPQDRRFTDFANTAIYAPTSYLPQALLLSVLRRVDCPPLVMLYACRLISLLCWLALTEAALRLLPFAGGLWAALALLPSSLVLHASAGADVLTNGLCALLTALLLRRAFGPPDEATNGRLALMAVLSAVVALNKIVYAPLVLLLALRPTRRNLLLSLGLLALNLLVVFSWNGVTRQLFIPYDVYHADYRHTQQLNDGVDPAAQLQYVVEHPVAFTTVAVKSLVRTVPSATMHYIGKFGWEKNYLPAVVVGFLLTLLLLLAAGEAEAAERLRPYHRVLLGGTAAAMTAGLVVVMYALWNPVGATFVHNLGGKYFIPIVPVALLAVVSGRLARWRMLVGMIIRGALGSALVLTAWLILERYYLHF